MAYATEADMTTRYGSAWLVRIADRDGSGAADSTAVSTALADASSEIDSILSHRYTVPISTVPSWLVRCTVDIAAYMLGVENRGSSFDDLRKRYDDWMMRLRELASGKAGDLGLGDDEPASLFDASFTSGEPLFSLRGTDPS
jgi:phage gp36-like protein